MRLAPKSPAFGVARTVGRQSLRWNLYLASALGLFFELALIRWIPNTVHVVAFFANLVLIGS